MRHGSALRKFGRNWSHRRAMLRNLATSFIERGRFETTVEKAKEVRPLVERLITLGKNDTLAARRRAYSYLTSKAVVHKLFTDIGPRFKERNGGYTRIVRTRVRHGDAAEMAVMELVEQETKKSSSKKSAAKKGGAKKTTGAKKTSTKKAASEAKSVATA